MPSRSQSRVSISTVPSVSFVLILAAAALVLVAAPSAVAQPNCVDDLTGVSNNCTSNDVSLTSVTVINTTDGCVGPTDTATVDIQATLQSGTTRYDIGIFLAQDGGDAFTGSCFHDFLGPAITPPPGHDPSSGTGPFADIEGVDACGDIVVGELTAKNVTNITVACADTDLDGFVDIGNCLSWDNQVSNNCADVSQAVPGTKAKCNCTRINTNLGVPNLTLSKSCTPNTNVAPGATVSCTITYQNTGTGPGDFITFVDDYSETQGTVSNIVVPGTDTFTDSGSAITWVPDGVANGGVAVAANIPAGTSGTMTYDLTLSGTLVDGEQVPNTVTAHWQGVAQSSLSAMEIINIQANAVLVSSFEVEPLTDGRAVVWETTSESRTAGFFVERWDARANGFVRLHPDPVPAVLQPQGGVYRFVDVSVQPGNSFLYRLIELEFDGRELVVDTYRRTLSAGRGVSSSSELGGGGSFSRRPRRFDASSPGARRGGNRRGVSGGNVRPRFSTGDVGDARMKLYLRESTVYHVVDTAIAEAYGLGVRDVQQAIQRGRVRLERRGESIPWLAASDGTSIAFYAPPFERNFTLEDVVWLDLDFGTRLRPAPRRRLAGAADPSRTFRDTIHVEEEILGAVALGSLDPAGDFWFWSFLQGRPGSAQSFELMVPDPGAVPATARVSVDFQGFAAGAEHHYSVSLNGLLLGETSFVGDVRHTASFDLDASALAAGANELVIGPAPGAPSFLGAFLDGFSIDYPRQYRARSDQLAFTGDEDSVVTVSGFSRPEISVWDVSEPDSPRMVSASLARDGVQWQATIEVVPGARYLAIASSAIGEPDRWESVSRPSLSTSLDGVDYVIVTPRFMEAEAQDFAAYRSRTGFRPLVATLEDVQNEFGDGLWDPRALRAFLQHWHSRMSPGQTGYALLAGKGTYDYRDLFGAGTNLIPPLLMSTHWGLVASDHLFGDVVGDDLVPEIAVARVPVVDGSELSAYFEKVRAYESADPTAPWKKKLVFVADNADAAGDFATDTQAIIDLAPTGFESVPIFLGQTHGPADGRDALLQTWNEGALLVAYTGHASQILWANENLFDMSAAASLTNGERLPLLVGLACHMGRFDYPTFGSLASATLLNPAGGSIAVVSPSGASVNLRAVRLGGSFIDRVLTGHEPLGSAMLSTFQEVKSDASTLKLLATYNFLGDPGVSLR